MGIFSKKISTEVAHQLRQQVTPYHYERPGTPGSPSSPPPVIRLDGNNPISMAIGQVMTQLAPNESFYASFEPLPNGGVSVAVHRKSMPSDVETIASRVVDEMMRRQR